MQSFPPSGSTWPLSHRQDLPDLFHLYPPPLSSLLLSSYQGSLDVLFLAGFAVLLLASPGLQCWGLQGPTKGEGQGPGPVQRTLVDGVQVNSGLFLTLTTGQEGHTLVGGEICRSYVSWKYCVLVVAGCANIYAAVSPGTAGGTVRRRAVTVAMAISCALNFFRQECPAVTMLGLSSVPSR